MDERRAALGARIANLREGKGLSQPQLATDAGISQPSLWEIEKGRTKEVTAKTLFAISRALGTTVDYLWEGGEGTPEAAKEEAELVQIFRKLAPNGRMALLQSARTVLAALPTAPVLLADTKEAARVEREDALADSLFAEGRRLGRSKKPAVKTSRKPL